MWNVDFSLTRRSNPRGTECVACAGQPDHAAAVQAACGRTDGGESLETMVPKGVWHLRPSVAPPAFELRS